MLQSVAHIENMCTFAASFERELNADGSLKNFLTKMVKPRW